MARVERIGDATLYLGDCREVMAGFEIGSFASVITDPPYGINTKSDGTAKLSPWADLCNAAFWYADWLKTCRMLTFGSGCVWSFLNWRSLVTFQKASHDIAWPIESLLVWDKDWIGPGGPKGLRPSYEMVALFANVAFSIPDRSVRDIQQFKWSGHKPNGHPAEKPQTMCEWLIEISTQPTQPVLDPFMGSGTTGCAALATGRKFTGIEIDEKWFDAACRRIEASAKQTRLFTEPAPRAVQEALL